MTYTPYRHDTPHAQREVEGRGLLLAFDPTCAECERIAFCTWCQGPCEINGPIITPVEEPRRAAWEETYNHAPDCDFDPVDFGPLGDEDDSDGGPVYSYSDPCPVCGEVHPT